MKFFLTFIVGLIMVVGVLVLAKAGGDMTKVQVNNPLVSPTPESQVKMLTPEQYPKVSLTFRADGRYVTVNMTNVNASALEYNLIYDATVKKNKLQTGVSASAKLEGKNTYTKEQLLGSESSGKFTYHENIQNAVLELTLRDENGRSVYSATYPFEVTPGKSVELTPRS